VEHQTTSLFPVYSGPAPKCLGANEPMKSVCAVSRLRRTVKHDLVSQSSNQRHIESPLRFVTSATHRPLMITLFFGATPFPPILMRTSRYLLQASGQRESIRPLQNETKNMFRYFLVINKHTRNKTLVLWTFFCCGKIFPTRDLIPMFPNFFNVAQMTLGYKNYDPTLY